MRKRTLLTVLVAGGLLAIAVVGAAWATSDRAALHAASPGDPGGIARFSLTVDGRELGSFAELEQLSSGADPVDLVTTQDRTLLPAKRTPDALVLKRGLTTNLELAAWHDLVLDGDLSARKQATLVMYSYDGTPVARYHLENAWPSKIQISGLADGTSITTETVTIVAERIHRVAP